MAQTTLAATEAPSMTSTDVQPEMNLATFVEVLKRSRLVDAERLRRTLRAIVLSGSETKPTPREVAEKLINAGLLTEWQVTKLLKGKYRGFTLGKYVMRRPLGRGGMGVVYEAEHAVLGTRVAVKLLPKAKNSQAKAVSRFLAEARAAAKLDHPHLTRVHDCDVIEGRRFMVMELIPGTDLAELVLRNGPLPIRLALSLLRQAALGLEHAHESGVVHRDVKPQNFLVDRAGHLKVTDLGLALFQVDSPTRYTQDGENQIVGTVDFVAPEQAWESTTVDRRADIYALGCTLYFMLTGQAPFGTGTLAQRIAKHQTVNAPAPSDARQEVPAAVDRLCGLMMEKKPQDRVQRMAEVAEACDQILAQLSSGSDDGLHLQISGPKLRPPAADRNRWNSTELLGLEGEEFVADTSFEFGPEAFGTGLASDPSPFGPPPVGHGPIPGALPQTVPAGQVPAAPAQPAAAGYWQPPAAAAKSAAAQRYVLGELLTSQQFWMWVGLTVAVLSIALTLWNVFSQSDVAPVKFKTFD